MKISVSLTALPFLSFEKVLLAAAHSFVQTSFFVIKLNSLQDEQYVVDYCLKAPWPTFETTEKMLNHAASRYSSIQIQEALARLATFCSLHGLENFK